MEFLYTETFTQQNEHCDWLILGHILLIKLKCIPKGIQFIFVTCVLNTIAHLFVFAIRLLKGESKYITKHLMYGPSGN